MAKKKKELKTSETRVVKRSSITLNPVNPKRHKEEKVKLQERNLRKVGYLGGIVWNESTGNLIDGHRRVMAMDSFYGYDGTPEKDYDIKVEVAVMDEGQEKQQLAYMAMGDTKADIDLFANIADEIDMTEIGLEQSEIDDILNIAHGSSEPTPDLFEELIKPSVKVPEKHTEEYEAKKEAVKEIKEMTREKAQQTQQDEQAHITLSFSNYDNLMAFCDLMGVSPNTRFVKGEELLKMFE